MPRRNDLIVLLLTVALMVGCHKGPPPSDVVLWTAFDDAELTVLRERIGDFEKESGFTVNILKVPFPSFRNKVLVASPAGQGPDILLAPNDWIGMLQTADLLSPIPQSVVPRDDQNFYPIALQAVSYADDIYSVPMMMECVVLARNTDLCPKRPENLEDLVNLALRCQEDNKDTLGFAYALDDFFFSWAFLAGFGADFLTPFEEKTLAVDSINFDTPAAVAGADWVASLRLEHDLVPKGMMNQTAVEYFLKNRLGMMLCGPWDVGAIRRAGVSYILEPLPNGPAGPSSPFVGVTGAMLGKHSADKPGVQELLKFLASPETSAQLCESSGRAPTRKDTAQTLKQRVTDPVVARDLTLFSEAAKNGTPMPNHPAMAAVWEPMKQALELITTGQTGAQEELKRTTERVRTKIRFMME